MHLPPPPIREPEVKWDEGWPPNLYRHCRIAVDRRQRDGCDGLPVVRLSRRVRGWEDCGWNAKGGGE